MIFLPSIILSSGIDASAAADAELVVSLEKKLEIVEAQAVPRGSVCLRHTMSGGPSPCMEGEMSEYGDLRSLQVQKVTAQAQWA